MKIVKIVNYQLKLYFKGTGFVMPFVVMSIFLYLMYSQKPIEVLSGFLITGIFSFFIMVWVGNAIAQQENKEMEQILIFKVNSTVIYFVGKFLFLVVLALIFTGICISFPIIENLINNCELFERKLVGSDIIGAVLIISSSAICGAFLGNLFHPRAFKDRSFSYIVLVLICVMSVAKVGMIQQVSFLKYALWIFPNITYASKIFANAEYFDVFQSLKVFLTFLLYAAVYGVLESILCYKNKF